MGLFIRGVGEGMLVRGCYVGVLVRVFRWEDVGEGMSVWTYC